MIMELSNDFMRALQLDTYIQTVSRKGLERGTVTSCLCKVANGFYVLSYALHNGHSIVNDIYDPP